MIYTEIGQIIATLLIGFGLIKSHMDLRNSISSQNAKIDARIDAQNTKIDSRIDAQNAKIDARIDAMGHRIDEAHKEIMELIKKMK